MGWFQQISLVCGYGIVKLAVKLQI